MFGSGADEFALYVDDPIESVITWTQQSLDPYPQAAAVGGLKHQLMLTPSWTDDYPELPCSTRTRMRDTLLTNLFSTGGVIFPVTKKATHMADPP
jgi:hypothetical protein